MVNKSACLELADFIEKSNVKFDMTVWFYSPNLAIFPLSHDIWEYTKSLQDTSSEHYCGTAGCIAGFGAMLWGQDAMEIASVCTARILGLDKEQAKRLFTPVETDDIDRTAAVKVLRILAETGEINWSQARFGV